MRYVLNEADRKHLQKVCRRAPIAVKVHDHEYQEHYEQWSKTLPGADHETLHRKAIAHAVWAGNVSTAEELPRHNAIKWELRAIAFLILALLLFLLLARPAHAQFSKISAINFQQGGSAISGAYFTYPFNINCVGSLTCTVNGNTLSMSASGGGTGCNTPGGTNDLLFDTGTGCGDVTKFQWNSGTTTLTGLSGLTFDLSSATLVKQRVGGACTASVNGDFCYDSTNSYWRAWQGAADRYWIATTNLGSSGQALLSNADGSGTFADPIVSGPDAPGSAPTKNPVQIGAFDGTNVQRVSSDTSGRLNVNINGTVPVSSTQLPAALDGSGYLKVHEQGTATVSGTVTANQGGNWTDRIVGNSGGVLDAAAGGSAAANSLQAGGVYNSSAPSPSTGQQEPLQLDSSANLKVNCVSGCGGGTGGTAIADEGTFTQGTTQFTPMGGYYNSSITNLSSGQGGAVQMTNTRHLMVEVENTPSVSISGTPTVTANAGTGQFNVTCTAANCPVNVSQFGGNAVVTGTGAGGSGIPRVTISNDSSLAANQSVNVNQVAGASTGATNPLYVAVADGTNGPAAVKAASTSAAAADKSLVVQISPNQPNLTSALNVSVSNTPSVTIQSNASVNLAQVNGTTASTGNGTTNAGDARVNIASDNSAVSGLGAGATASAVPANAIYHGGNGSGNLTGYLNCDNTAIYDASTNGATQLVALSSGKIVYVCGYQFSNSTTTAVNVDLVYGTATNCGTGQTKMTPAYPLQAVTSSGPIGLVVMTPGFTGLKTAASNELCILTNAAVSVQAIVWYTQF